MGMKSPSRIASPLQSTSSIHRNSTPFSATWAGTGYDVISQAKRQHSESRHASLVGIALTGFGMDEDIRRSKEAGFDYHLTKPVDFAQLRTLLGKIRN